MYSPPGASEGLAGIFSQRKFRRLRAAWPHSLPSCPPSTPLCKAASVSCASTTATAAMFTISCTSRPRCSTCAGFDIPIRIGPIVSAPPIHDSSLSHVFVDSSPHRPSALDRHSAPASPLVALALSAGAVCWQNSRRKHRHPGVTLGSICACTTIEIVPRFAFELSIVNGIRSPCSRSRRITNCLAWCFGAIRGASITKLLICVPLAES